MTRYKKLDKKSAETLHYFLSLEYPEITIEDVHKRDFDSYLRDRQVQRKIVYGYG